MLLIPQRYEFSSKSQLAHLLMLLALRCCWYHKGTNFQANHNQFPQLGYFNRVVADTTKVRIFKQITTLCWIALHKWKLLLIPQRYEFSSKSQLNGCMSLGSTCCCWYHKGTNFQANHNLKDVVASYSPVVADTTKVRIFKQITTALISHQMVATLLLIPQRYEFSSKSQLTWYSMLNYVVVADTTKVRIFKQITTLKRIKLKKKQLLLIPQRYEFSSKSQLRLTLTSTPLRCCWYHKGTNFQANHNTNTLLHVKLMLLLIPQRYEFSSKSQPISAIRVL